MSAPGPQPALSPMLNSALIGIGFLAVTVALLSLQPGAPAPTPTPPPAEVSRGAVDLLPKTPPPIATTDQNAVLSAAVTRALTPETGPATKTTPIPSQTRQAAAAIQEATQMPNRAAPSPTPDRGAKAGPVAASANAALSADTGNADMRAATFAVLRNLDAATGRDATPGAQGTYLNALVHHSMTDPALAPVLAPYRRAMSTDGLTPDPTATSLSPAPGRRYLVRAGDTLQSIAEAHYGDARLFQSIFIANRDVLASPDALRAGLILIIPDA